MSAIDPSQNHKIWSGLLMDMVVSVMSRAKVAMFILPCERVPLGKRAAMVMATAMLDTLFLKL